MSMTVAPAPAPSDAAARADGFQRVAGALQQLGHGHAPRWLEVAARTSQEAADALGVALGQIAKSVVFRRREDDQAVLVIASGDRRVDEQRLAALVGPVGRADAQFVKSRTGFAIGGVSPVGLAGRADAAARPRAAALRRDLGRGRAPERRLPPDAAGPAAPDRRALGRCGATHDAQPVHQRVPHGRRHRLVRRLPAHAAGDRHLERPGRCRQARGLAGAAGAARGLAAPASRTARRSTHGAPGQPKGDPA